MVSAPERYSMVSVFMVSSFPFDLPVSRHPPQRRTINPSYTGAAAGAAASVRRFAVAQRTHADQPVQRLDVVAQRRARSGMRHTAAFNHQDLLGEAEGKTRVLFDQNDRQALLRHEPADAVSDVLHDDRGQAFQ